MQTIHMIRLKYTFNRRFGETILCLYLSSIGVNRKVNKSMRSRSRIGSFLFTVLTSINIHFVIPIHMAGKQHISWINMPCLLVSFKHAQTFSVDTLKYKNYKLKVEPCIFISQKSNEQDHFLSLAPGERGCNIELVIFKSVSRICTLNISCEVCPPVIATKYIWYYINISSGNGLVPLGSTPYVIIRT